MSAPRAYWVLDAGGSPVGNPYTNPESWKLHVITQAESARPILRERWLRHYQPQLSVLRNSGDPALRGIAAEVEAAFQPDDPLAVFRRELQRVAGDE